MNSWYLWQFSCINPENCIHVSPKSLDCWDRHWEVDIVVLFVSWSTIGPSLGACFRGEFGQTVILIGAPSCFLNTCSMCQEAWVFVSMTCLLPWVSSATNFKSYFHLNETNLSRFNVFLSLSLCTSSQNRASLTTENRHHEKHFYSEDRPGYLSIESEAVIIPLQHVAVISRSVK